MTIKFSSEILFYAFRYALGRMTYAVKDVVNCLEQNWEKMDYQQKAVIQSEIREAISRNNAGDRIDVSEWTKILNLKNRMEERK